MIFKLKKLWKYLFSPKPIDRTKVIEVGDRLSFIYAFQQAEGIVYAIHTNSNDGKDIIIDMEYDSIFNGKLTRKVNVSLGFIETQGFCILKKGTKYV